MDFGDYNLVVEDPDGTVHEVLHTNRAGAIPNIDWTTDIPEIDAHVYRVTGVHLSPDPHHSSQPEIAGASKKKSRAKRFMVPRVVCQRLEGGKRPPSKPGSRFTAGPTKPAVCSIEESKRSGASPGQLINEYREQATKLSLDADDAVAAISSGQGWHLNPDLPQHLHELSRDAKRNAATLLFASGNALKTGSCSTADRGRRAGQSGVTLRLIPSEAAAQ